LSSQQIFEMDGSSKCCDVDTNEEWCLCSVFSLFDGPPPFFFRSTEAGRTNSTLLVNIGETIEVVVRGYDPLLTDRQQVPTGSRADSADANANASLSVRKAAGDYFQARRTRVSNGKAHPGFQWRTTGTPLQAGIDPAYDHCSPR
jgi:hypothetical protein